MEMKISKLDRAEALIRISEYKRDLEQLLKFREHLSKKKDAFIEKYAIQNDKFDKEDIVFNKSYGQKYSKLEETNLRQYLKKERAVLSKYGITTLVTPTLVESLKNPRVTAIYKKTGEIIPRKILQKKAPKIIEQQKRKGIEQASLFKNKPWITTIEVDLNLPIEESKFLAVKDIEAVYHSMEEFREKSKERNRDFTYYPWEIYDAHRIEGKSFTRIAKEKSGINKNPSHDPIVMAAYKAVTRAYLQAEKIIKQVETEINNN